MQCNVMLCMYVCMYVYIRIYIHNIHTGIHRKDGRCIWLVVTVWQMATPSAVLGIDRCLTRRNPWVSMWRRCKGLWKTLGATMVRLDMVGYGCNLINFWFRDMQQVRLSKTCIRGWWIPSPSFSVLSPFGLNRSIKIIKHRLAVPYSERIRTFCTFTSIRVKVSRLTHFFSRVYGSVEIASPNRERERELNLANTCKSMQISQI